MSDLVETSNTTPMDDAQIAEEQLAVFPWHLARRSVLAGFLLALFTPAAWPEAAWNWLWAAGGWALAPFAATIGFATGPIARLATASLRPGDLHRLELAERLAYLTGIIATVFRLRGMGSAAGATLEAREMLNALAPLELALVLYVAFQVLTWMGEHEQHQSQS